MISTGHSRPGQTKGQCSGGKNQQHGRCGVRASQSASIDDGTLAVHPRMSKQRLRHGVGLSARHWQSRPTCSRFSNQQMVVSALGSASSYPCREQTTATSASRPIVGLAGMRRRSSESVFCLAAPSARLSKPASLSYLPCFGRPGAAPIRGRDQGSVVR
jgi:hypothetical protein